MANFSQFQIVLTDLVDNDITTLKNSINPSAVVGTYQSVGQSGNLADLSIVQFNGTVTLRPVDPTNAVHRGETLSMGAAVVATPYDGWEPTP